MYFTNLFLTPEREAPPPPANSSWLSDVKPTPNTGKPTDTLYEGQLIIVMKKKKKKNYVCCVRET